MSTIVCYACEKANPEFNLTCSSCGAALGDLSSPASDGSALDRKQAGTQIDHYRIDGTLGAGGMGIVYRATDLELGRTVALKFLRVECARDTGARARFVREARAASALDHPHIGTIFEIGEHQGETFIAMAHYEGETLRERLSAGALSADQTIRLLRELASALSAAHGRASSTATSSRRMSSSLGTALRSSSTSAWRRSATRTHRALYRRARPRAPRGSWGHRCTWRRSSSTAARSITAPISTRWAWWPSRRCVDGTRPPPARSSPSSDTPPQLARLIAHLLERDPALRLQSAAELEAALAAPARGRRSRALIWGALLVVPLVLSALALRMPRSPAAAAQRPMIAMLGFLSQSDSAPSGVLEAIVRAQLTTSEKLRLVSAEQIDELRRNLGLKLAETYAKPTLERVHSNSGADRIIGGSLGTAKERLHATAYIQDAAAGEVLATVVESAPAIDELALRVAAGLRRALGVAPSSEEENDAARLLLPRDTEAISRDDLAGGVLPAASGRGGFGCCAPRAA